jgi:hypothetical protein
MKKRSVPVGVSVVFLFVLTLWGSSAPAQQAKAILKIGAEY